MARANGFYLSFHSFTHTEKVWCADNALVLHSRDVRFEFTHGYRMSEMRAFMFSSARTHRQGSALRFGRLKNSRYPLDRRLGQCGRGEDKTLSPCQEYVPGLQAVTTHFTNEATRLITCVTDTGRLDTLFHFLWYIK
jgi:hypothetical protein